jgi:hypothetical protein
VLDLVSRPEFWIGVLVAGAFVITVYLVTRMAIHDELESRQKGDPSRTWKLK